MTKQQLADLLNTLSTYDVDSVDKQIKPFQWGDYLKCDELGDATGLIHTDKGWVVECDWA